MAIGLVTMDCNGRIADATVFATLGWPAGTQLDIRVRGGLIWVSADPQGMFRIARAGQLRIPAAARHRCHLTAGDRLLLAADAAVLAVHPPGLVARMVATLHREVAQ